MKSERLPLKFVDAHIHLSDEEYQGCIGELLQEAKDSRVVAMVSNSTDLKTSAKSLELAEQFKNTVYAALGIHPWAVSKLADEELDQTLTLIRTHSGSESLVAIGEIGLDSKYMDKWAEQMKVFDSMLHIAEELKLPVIVHSRGTTSQIVEMLPSYNLRRILLHWFSNPISALSKAIEIGCYISEGAPTVFSNGIRDVVKRIPIDRLLTETDGPVRFFKPPFKGKRTSPALIPEILNVIAEILTLPPATVADQIAKNFEEFFNVKLI